MKFSLWIDRFEDETAILATADDDSIEFPRCLLPENAAEGAILVFSIALDQVAIDALQCETKRLQDEMKHRDPGGDIKL